MLLWSQIGYRLIDGQFQEGEVVTLERSADSYPEYFKENITPEDAVSSHVFHDVLEQARWIAGNIKINLEEDELDPDDILIVLPNALSSRREAQVIIDALWQQGINAHLVGVGNSQDEVFQQNSVAIAHIYRSKGNEAPMVYVANAQHCVAGPGLITRRNTLFTAITRSKAWVRICGWGPDMWELQAEIEAIKNNDYRLRFKIPTQQELANIRRIHRDLTRSERAKINQANDGLKTFVDALEEGQVLFDEVSLDLKATLQKYFAQGTTDDAR